MLQQPPAVTEESYIVLKPSPVPGNERRVLSMLSVLSLCYFSVCGGPIGSEEIISAGGPLIGWIGLLIFPILWSIPTALITAELSTAFPDDGGYTVWVHNAFGPFWGFQEGYWAWVSGVIDNAIYPSLILSIITQAYGKFGTPCIHYCIKAAITIVLAIPTLFGINIVGQGMTMLSIMVMVPFLVMSIWGLPQVDWSLLGQIRHENTGNATATDLGDVDINWNLLLNMLFWNFNGFISISVFAGEVADPGKSYPKALILSVVLVVLSYFIPLAVATGVNDPAWWDWQEGSLSSVARAVGGDFLVAWTVFASVCSNIGMYMTELFVDSFQLLGMAEEGLAPALFARRHSVYNTPRNAVYASLVLMLLISLCDFDEIIVMNNSLSAISNIAIFFAAIMLRQTHPEVERPFKVPGGTVSLTLLSIPPTLIGLYISYTTIESALLLAFIIGSLLLGVVLYFICRNNQKRSSSSV